MYEIIKELESTGSNPKKIAILKQHIDNTDLQWFFKAALSPRVVYGMKKVLTPDANIGLYTLEDAKELISKLAEGILTGNAAREAVEDASQCLTEADFQILKRVIEKDPDCGVLATTVNKVWKKLIDVWKWRGATSCDKEAILNKMNWQHAMAQVKMDGERLTMVICNGVVSGYTRSGQSVPLSEKLQNEFLEAYDGDTVIDGEVVCHEPDGSIMSREKSNGILNHIVKGKPTEAELDSVHHYGWDRIDLYKFYAGKDDNVSYQRYNAVIDNFGGRLHKVECHQVRSYEEALSVFAKVTQAGGEGIILKDGLAPWVPGKSHKKDWKFKEEFVFEFKVIGFNHHSKDLNRIGSLIATSACKELTTGAGSGLKKEDTNSDFGTTFADKIISIKFNDLKKNSDGIWALTNPVFVKVRHEKEEADTVEHMLQEMEEIRKLY